ncbi:hypothetical protein CASFOL_034614 [Castilleja foliolosa]|uniref:DUF4216 domain-containing protein n=1 Tax=Castilleja foliolosa TaxID=1961234 RepID=A0ABD3BQZ4_9LAMI
MNLDGKTKDTVKARLDLEDMNIRKELHLIKKANDKYAMPAASYVMTKKERQEFCEFIRSVKFLDRYDSNISRCITSSDQKLSGMKSHDCHVILQCILPVGIRGSVTKEVREVLTELGHFFQHLCCKKLSKTELEKMKGDIGQILCKLERFILLLSSTLWYILLFIYQTRQFLVTRFSLGGCISLNVFLFGLKQSVRNKARPEGSVAEAYIAKECLTFCSMYLKGIETRFNREDRNNDIELDDSLPIFSQKCRLVGSTTYMNLSVEELKALTWFVFKNCEEVEQFLKMRKEELVVDGCMNLEREHKEKFPAWFKKHIIGLYNNDPSGVNESLYSLASAPNRYEIIQLDYVIRDWQVILFKCDWFDLGRKKLTRITKEGNIISVRVDRKWYEEDSYILADQARQVFYINDPKLGRDWRVVIPVSHRHVYDVSEMINEEVDDDDVLFVENGVYQENDTNDALEVNLDEIPSLRRNDLDPEDVDASLGQGLSRMGDVADIDDVDDLDDTMVDYYSSDDEGSQKSNNSDYDIDSDAS